MKGVMRLWRSYHFRNVTVATLLSGALIVAITVVYARSVRLADRTRLESEMRELSLVHLTNPFRSPEEWQELDEQLRRETPAEVTPPMILVRDGTGREIYRSPQWRIAPNAREILSQDEIKARFAQYLREHGMQRFPEPGELGQGVPPPPPPTLKYHNWLDEEGRLWRVGITGTPHLSLALARDWSQRKEPYSRMVKTMVATLPAVLMLLAGISYVLSYRALRPLRQLQATAERITVHELDERIDAARADIEFDGLIQVFNKMLDRLEGSFKIANEFGAAAAHELKTPLAVLQAEMERGIQETDDGSEEQARYSRLLEQVRNLKTITHKLLLLAAVDAKGLRLNPEDLDMSDCVLDACDAAAMLAPDIGQEKRIPSVMRVWADPELLPQVVTNLIVNAVKHNQPNGNISVELAEGEEGVQLTVSNTGPGIALEEQAHVFRRFYRTDKSRTRDKGGSGLGLSLAREIARAHGGDVELLNSQAGQTTFRLRLPRRPAGA